MDTKHRTESSKYPLEDVYQSVGGIRIVISNEEGKESYRIMHPSGSYTEMQPDGTTVNFNIGKATTYVKGGLVLSVDENNDVRISGHNTLRVAGGSHIEVAGDAGIMVKGDVALAGLGNMGMSVNGNVYLGAKGDFNMNVAGKASFKVAGDLTMGSGTFTAQATSINLNPGGSATGYG